MPHASCTANRAQPAPGSLAAPCLPLLWQNHLLRLSLSEGFRLRQKTDSTSKALLTAALKAWVWLRTPSSHLCLWGPFEPQQCPWVLLRLVGPLSNSPPRAACIERRSAIMAQGSPPDPSGVTGHAPATEASSILTSPGLVHGKVCGWEEHLSKGPADSHPQTTPATWQVPTPRDAAVPKRHSGSHSTRCSPCTLLLMDFSASCSERISVSESFPALLQNPAYFHWNKHSACSGTLGRSSQKDNKKPQSPGNLESINLSSFNSNLGQFGRQRKAFLSRERREGLGATGPRAGGAASSPGGTSRGKRLRWF